MPFAVDTSGAIQLAQLIVQSLVKDAGLGIHDSGIELGRGLAATGRELPTILMSGVDDRRTTEVMRGAEPIACLFKPFDQKQLTRAIRKALAKA